MMLIQNYVYNEYTLTERECYYKTQFEACKYNFLFFIFNKEA